MENILGACSKNLLILCAQLASKPLLGLLLLPIIFILGCIALFMFVLATIYNGIVLYFSQNIALLTDTSLLIKKNKSSLTEKEFLFSDISEIHIIKKNNIMVFLCNSKIICCSVTDIKGAILKLEENNVPLFGKEFLQ